MAESTVETKTFHGLTIGCDTIELFSRGVNRMREVDWLIESLFESEYRNRLTEPASDYKCCDYTHHGNYTETANSQYRHKHLR
jgi:hypothetical protein